MKTQDLENDTVKQTVRERYGQIASRGGSCGCGPTCCSPSGPATKDGHDPTAVSQGLGYSASEMGAVPEGSNLGLGCGNPQAIAALKLGETVLDLADPATAQDILQDVFVKIQKRLGQLKDPAKLEGWIYLIARNAIIDHYRTRKETVEVPETLPAEPDSRDGALEELLAAFRRMVYSLPEPYREALVLTEFDGLTQQDLANRLGISLSGAKSRVQRGRAQLKQMLNECCTFEFDRRGHAIDCQPRHPTACSECSTSTRSFVDAKKGR